MIGQKVFFYCTRLPRQKKKGVIYWQKVKSAKKKEKNAIVCWEVEDSVKGLGMLGNIFNKRKQNYVTFWMTAKNKDSVQGLC